MDVRSVGGTNRLQPDFTRVNELAVRSERLPRRKSDAVLPFPPAMWLWVGSASLVRLGCWLAGAAAAVAAVCAVLVLLGGRAAAWCWLGALVVALLALLAAPARDLVRRRDAKIWQQAVAGEYWSWRRPPRRFEPVPAAAPLPAWLRDPLHRRLLGLLRRPGTASHADKLRWAGRWARSRRLRPLVPRLAVLAALSVLLTVAAWRAGLIEARPGRLLPEGTGIGGYELDPAVRPAVDLALAAAADYAWHLLDLVPLLHLTEVFGWTRPPALAASGLHNVFAEVLRLGVLWLVAVAVLAPARRPVEVDARPPLLAGQVERALVDALVSARRLLTASGTDRHDLRLLDDACRRLRAGEVPVPAPHETWSIDSLCQALAVEQSWMADWRIPEQRTGEPPAPW
ncbi:hypothetical protein Cs7R123_60390 [Catellatospora sp. TT07R-123]|uniref:hypothetical protein n=1 Tax=Catellatospora sp. TT07R-123 TaxID=2733863 RepID=UPI001B1B4839|nr:hypothetical protein [Catellatospora sp. TT07R-123]GHJ48697.1 hypothetical protein Cs7R123_60390 [Catellatospora sp. TT07R-123]